MKAREEMIEALLTAAGCNLTETEDVIAELNQMGYFTAPASRGYHLAYEGGLADHSINVTKELVKLTNDNNLKWKNARSPYIVGLFHDLCKCDQYIRTESGFEYNNDSLLRGHGEKSAIMAGQIITLNVEEICCIRYHMGAYYKKDWDGFDKSIKRYPNVLWTHMADMIASKLIEI